MALEKKTKTVLLSKGMRDDVDQFQLEPPHVAEVKNGVFSKGGVIKKRLGLSELASGAQTGDPIAVLEENGKVFVQGTSGVYAADTGSYVEVNSEVVPSSITKSEVTPSRVNARKHSFDVSGDRYCDVYLCDRASGYQFNYRVRIDSGRVITGTYGPISGETPLTCKAEIRGDIAHVVVATTDGTDTDVNYIGIDLTDGTTTNQWASTLSGESPDTTTNANAPGGSTHTRPVFSDEDFALAFFGFSNIGPVLIYQDTGDIIPDPKKRAFQYATGAVQVSLTFTQSGDLITGYADSDYSAAVIQNPGQTAVIVERVTAGGAADQSASIATTAAWFCRGSYTRAGGQQAVALTEIEYVTGTDRDQWARSSGVGASVGRSGTSYCAQTNVYRDSTESGSYVLEEGFANEQLSGHILCDADNILVPAVPFVPTPYLTEQVPGNVDGLQGPLSVPLAYKPVSTVLYCVGFNKKLVVGTLSTSSTVAYDYFKTIKSNFVPGAAYDSGKWYFSAREISCAPNVGYHDGNGDDQNDFPGQYRHQVACVELVSPSFPIVSASGTYLPGGAFATLSGGEVSLAAFTNAPEITEVYYEGFENVDAEPGNSLEGHLSSAYEPISVNVAGNGGYDGVWSVGFNIVLSATTSSGKKILSAPSQTVYIPKALHMDANDNYIASDITLGFYIPAVLPQNTQVEIYAFSALNTMDTEITIDTAASLVSIHDVQPITADKPATFCADNYVKLDTRGPTTAGWTNEGLLTVPFTDMGSKLLYTESKLASDTPSAVINAVTAKDRVFFTDNETLFFSTTLTRDDVPVFPVSFTLPLTQRNPLAIAPLDDKIVIFYRNTIAVVFGNGPDDLGNGPNFSIQELPGETGLKDIPSVCSVPQGLLFRSDRGFFLLDRGLVLNYQGGVEDILRDTEVISSVTVERDFSCIFSLNKTGSLTEFGDADLFDTTNRPPIPHHGNVADSNEGLAVVYNYRDGNWSTFTNYDFVAMEDIGGTVTAVRDDWQLMQEHSGYEDSGSPSTKRQNFLYIKTPWIKWSNMQDYGRLYMITLLGRYYSNKQGSPPDAGDINVWLCHDYKFDPFNQDLLQVDWTVEELDMSESGGIITGVHRLQGRIRPKRQKCQSAQLIIFETESASSSVGRGFEVSSLDFEYALKGGSSRLHSSRSK